MRAQLLRAVWALTRRAFDKFGKLLREMGRIRRQDFGFHAGVAGCGRVLNAVTHERPRLDISSSKYLR